MNKLKTKTIKQTQIPDIFNISIAEFKKLVKVVNLPVNFDSGEVEYQESQSIHNLIQDWKNTPQWIKREAYLSIEEKEKARKYDQIIELLESSKREQFLNDLIKY